MPNREESVLKIKDCERRGVLKPGHFSEDHECVGCAPQNTSLPPISGPRTKFYSTASDSGKSDQTNNTSNIRKVAVHGKSVQYSHQVVPEHSIPRYTTSRNKRFPTDRVPAPPATPQLTANLRSDRKSMKHRISTSVPTVGV